MTYHELSSPKRMLEFLRILEVMTKCDLTIEVDGHSFDRKSLEGILEESRALDARCSSIDNLVPLR